MCGGSLLVIIEKSHPVHTKSVCISSGKKVEGMFT